MAVATQPKIYEVTNERRLSFDIPATSSSPSSSLSLSVGENLQNLHVPKNLFSYGKHFLTYLFIHIQYNEL